jgi:hypothetical protein
MRHRIFAAALTLALAAILTGAAPANATVDPYCGITWGSQARTAGALSTAPLLSTRTGRHGCWDRLVFEFNGTADGYRIHYGETYTEGQGTPLSPYTAGGALINVQLWAPSYDDRSTPTYPARTGDHVANVVGYDTLRDVVFGGSYEGYTTFAVGVRARLPFRVFVLAGPGSHSRIVLDVAHRW